MTDADLLAGVRSLRWLMEEVRWDEARPRAAPQFRCHVCRRWIAKNQTLVLLNREAPGQEPITLHLRCMDQPTPREAHARWYPDCPERWHDMYDHHEHAMGSRAGIAAVLKVWPQDGGNG